MAKFERLLRTENRVELCQSACSFCAASAANYSGTCGDNLTWSVDTSTGALTISGTGAMDNWTNSSKPWQLYYASITSVTIGDSVTSVVD